MAHGLCIWFDAELADGIGFSNAPGRPELIYGQAFFPLQKEVAIEAGDRISVALKANLVGDDYIVSWRTSITSRSGSEKASFQQSTFHSQPVALARIKRTEAQFVPATREEQQMDRHCLGFADGRTCLGDIAESLARAFPHRFEKHQLALAYVAALFERYRQPEVSGGSSPT
jgi:protein arginine N-methyltransferase 1